MPRRRIPRLALAPVIADDNAHSVLGRERNAMTGSKATAPASAAPDETESCLLRVRGLVQGVGFRHSLCVEARQAGLAGWVRNRHDGSVEAHLQGAPAAVAELVAWAHHGPPVARVDTVELSPAAAEPALRTFEQRPTA